MDATIEKIIHVMSSIHKLQLSVKELEDSNELTVYYVKRECTKLEERVKELRPSISRCVFMYREYVEEFETKLRDRIVTEKFFRIKRFYGKEVLAFKEFQEKYQNYIPKDIIDIKKQVRQKLEEVGYEIDGAFEGDFTSWVGVYARPKDKPTYLDPANAEEVVLQEKYSVNGFKQDFSEWFEFEIKDNVVYGI